MKKVLARYIAAWQRHYERGILSGNFLGWGL
jgi:hypothetical protein